MGGEGLGLLYLVSPKEIKYHEIRNSPGNIYFNCLSVYWPAIVLSIPTTVVDSYLCDDDLNI